MRKFTLVVLIIVFSQLTASAIERRSEQFPTEFGYLALPLPYIIPGAGSGFGILGGFNNVPFGSLETTLDLFAIGIAGDIGGNILFATDFPVYPKTILLDFGQGILTRGHSDHTVTAEWILTLMISLSVNFQIQNLYSPA